MTTEQARKEMEYTVIASYWGGPWEEIGTYDDINDALIRRDEIKRDAMGKRVDVDIREDSVNIEE